MMEVWNMFWAKLAGKKTYLIVAAFMLCVVLEKYFGLDVPFFAVGDNWMPEVLGMLGLGTLRAGVEASKKV